MQQSESDSASTNTSSRQRKPSRESSPKVAARGAKILWSEWWPFTRATGDALKQLNRPQRKDAYPHDVEDALI